jgi:hypothetical protein
MNQIQLALSLATVAFEMVLCGLVFANRVQRTLPFFAAYASTLLANTVAVWLVYRFFGFRSPAAYFSYWPTLLFNAGMRSLAIAELCRYKLRGYPGIWGLVWRLLIGIAAIFLLHAAWDTSGQPNRLAIYSLVLDRDLAVASVAILAALLLLHNYYRLSLEPLQRKISAGICLVCAVDVVGDTILRGLFTGYLLPYFSSDNSPYKAAVAPFFERITQSWSVIHLCCFMVTMGIWCYAVRKPVPAPADAPELLPAHVYRELSPAINLRLNAFNDRLVELLKP